MNSDPQAAGWLSRNRRRFTRFSLMSVLVLTTLVAYFATYVSSWRQEAKAVRELTSPSVGGSVKSEPRLIAKVTPEYVQESIDPLWFERTVEASVELTFDKESIERHKPEYSLESAAESLDELSHTNLRHLTIRMDNGWPRNPAVEKLEERLSSGVNLVNGFGRPVSDPLTNLVQVEPKSIVDSEVPPSFDFRSLGNFKQLAHLEVLGASSTRVEEIGRYANSSRLTLYGCSVDENAMKAIVANQKIKLLTLDRVKISGSTLQLLSQMKQLKWLQIQNCEAHLNSNGSFDFCPHVIHGGFGQLVDEQQVAPARAWLTKVLPNVGADISAWEKRPAWARGNE
jgi:hypothetical protein